MSDAEKQVEEFLAGKPSWFRKWVERKALRNFEITPKESMELLDEIGVAPIDEWIEDYEGLLQRIPARWKEYKRVLTRDALARLPAAKPGRPRKDAIAEEAKELQAQGNSYAQAARKLGTTKEALRKLIKRKRIGFV